MLVPNETKIINFEDKLGGDYIERNIFASRACTLSSLVNETVSFIK